MIENLEFELQQWIDSHTAKEGAKPDSDAILLNPLYIQLTKLYEESAVLAVGGCETFVRRRKRYCTSRATVGSKYCTMHREAPKAPAIVQSLPLTTSLIGKKTNLKKRMKRCLNPFKIQSIETGPKWNEIFADLTLPTVLDIGCAKGGYIERLRTLSCSAEKDGKAWSQNWNFVGVELFNPLVLAANKLELQRNNGMKNLHYVHCNVNIDFELLQIPNIRRITFLFPDPWSCGPSAKDKNKKKRVMNRDFALRIANVLVPDGLFYFCSDWIELAEEIRDCLLGTGCFEIPVRTDADQFASSVSLHVSPFPYIPTLKASEIAILSTPSDRQLIDVDNNYLKPVESRDNDSLWLSGIPFDGVQTERDLVSEAEWRAVYRLVLIRKK